MKSIFYILLIVMVIITACKKDPKIIDPVIPSSNEPKEFVFSPCALLNEPIFGWRDSTKGTETDLYRVLINPLNEKEIIYLAGTVLYNYNTQTKARNRLCNDVALTPGTPSISRDGWITYNNFMLQTCVIKSNGDSLKALGTSNALYPRWDYTGNFIYFQKVNLFKISKNGGVADSVLSYGILGVAKTSNVIISSRPSQQELFSKDLTTGIEKTIRKGYVQYDFLVFDNKDENIYWWADNGIYQYNFATQITDTLVKNCPVGTPNNPASANSLCAATNISPNSNKLTFVYKEFIPVSVDKRYTKSHALQMDLTTKKITEIKLFE